LRIYQEDSNDFQAFERDYRSLTKTLYAWYCKVHKEHSVAFKALPKSVQPLVFDLHKFYLGTLRPSNKTLHMVEVIDWIVSYLKSPYGVPNMIRFSKETEQPPAANSIANGVATSRQVVQDGNDIRITVSIDDTGATAPVSPAYQNDAGSPVNAV
jgi:hypothetical protein